MPFFEKEKILFIHIPKTGGTSVEKYFSMRTRTVLGPNSLYLRYYSNTIQSELDKYKRLWKTRQQLLTTSNTNKNIFKLKNTALTPNSIENDEDSDNKNNNLIEYRMFKRVRLMKDLEHSLQHITWLEMQEHKNILWDTDKQRDIVSNDLYQRNDCEIITVVRNPYDRIISELLFNGILTADTIRNQSGVYRKLKKYLSKDDSFDNHKLPQFMYITDIHGELIENIIILRTETLTADMKHIGFVDFNYNLQTSKSNLVPKDTKYSAALNKKSINLINQYYKRDFELFGYTILE
jgi:hypothetical protein